MGTIKFGETSEVILKREILEEVGVDIKMYKLLDSGFVTFE